MILKDVKNKFIYEYFFRTIKLKFFSTIILILVLISSFISLGVYIEYTGKNRILKGWAQGLYHNGVQFIPNYFKSLFTDVDRIKIDINFEDYQKLAYKREESLHRGSLVSLKKDWVSAFITHKEKKYKAEIRLKGDLPDHWEKDEMWSFKIKIKGDNTLFGMKRFAIQSPDTRGYLNEYVFQKLLRYNKLISLRYDFIGVTINGRKQSIYALEENFDKLLIENNRFREGPIFQVEEEIGTNHNKERLWGTIKPYQENKMVKNSILLKQFSRAKSLFELFRQRKIEPSQVFDLKKLSMLFAILDLTGNHHASHLDNLKFYFNPVTSLIEPIGYDNQLINHLKPNGMIGENIPITPKNISSFKNNLGWYDILFSDKTFYKNYSQALEEISVDGYLETFFKDIKKELRKKTKILHKSYPWYSFEKAKETLYLNQSYIKEKLKSEPKLIQIHYKNFSEINPSLIFQYFNLHSLPIEILGISFNDSEIIKLDSIILLQPKVDDWKTENQFTISKRFNLEINKIKKTKFHYRIFGSSSEASSKVFLWPIMDERINTENIANQKNALESLIFFDYRNNNELHFKTGDWEIREKLILPRDYRVFIYEGTKLDFLDSANIISFSSINISGTNNNPVIITSSDSTGQGITVINSKDKSFISNVHFNNLSSLSQNGWSLTGAVNFYQSPVNIENCSFNNMRSEDALNLIRTRFSIKKTLFLNSLSDALDCDFTTGKIIETNFINSGNDAIDLSGSILDLKSIMIRLAGDKAISAGEKSIVQGENISIFDSELGIAAKDLSVFNLKNIKIENTKVGLLAFQKKAEYGKAKITVDDYEFKQVKIPTLIERESVLTLNGVQKTSKYENIEDVLYGKLYGKSSQ